MTTASTFQDTDRNDPYRNFICQPFPYPFINPYFNMLAPQWCTKFVDDIANEVVKRLREEDDRINNNNKFPNINN